MIFNMGRGYHTAGQLRQIISPADEVQFLPFLQLLFDRQDIHRPLLTGQFLYGRIDLLVHLRVKALRCQQVEHGQDRILLQHDSPQDGLLQLHRLRRQFTQVQTLRHTLHGGTSLLLLFFCHHLKYFPVKITKTYPSYLSFFILLYKQNFVSRRWKNNPFFDR